MSTPVEAAYQAEFEGKRRPHVLADLAELIELQNPPRRKHVPDPRVGWIMDMLSAAPDWMWERLLDGV